MYDTGKMALRQETAPAPALASSLLRDAYREDAAPPLASEDFDDTVST